MGIQSKDLKYRRAVNPILAPWRLLAAQLLDVLLVLEVDVIVLHEHPLLAVREQSLRRKRSHFEIATAAALDINADRGRSIGDERRAGASPRSNFRNRLADAEVVG